MGSLILRPGELITFKFGGAAIQDEGYVLMWDSSNGYAKVHDGNATTPILGVNFMSTEDPTQPGTYLTSGYIAVQVDGVAKVKLSDSNSAINIGDRVAVQSGGVVDKYDETTPADQRLIVGIALESKAASSGGHIKVLLRLK